MHVSQNGTEMIVLKQSEALTRYTTPTILL